MNCQGIHYTRSAALIEVERLCEKGLTARVTPCSCSHYRVLALDTPDSALSAVVGHRGNALSPSGEGFVERQK